MQNAAVVVAAGSGSRFEGEGPRKQYRALRGTPLLAWSLAAFDEHPLITSTVVVVPPEDVTSPPEWLRAMGVRLVPGGAERSDSVRAGLEALDAVDRVLIHDGARPLVTRALIDRILDTEPSVAVIPGLPVTDTLKEVESGRVVATPERARYWRAQTPQAFPFRTIRSLHREAARDGFATTDDAALFERYGHTVRIVEGDEQNIKVTTRFDLEMAHLLAQRLSVP